MREGGGGYQSPCLNHALQIEVFWCALSISVFLHVCLMCVSVSSAAIVSSEQNPVIIIAVVAVAGTIILVFMVFGFIIGRRYALAGPIDSPLLWVCACQLAFLSLTGLHVCGLVTCTHTCTHHLVACCANGLWCITFFFFSPALTTFFLFLHSHFETKYSRARKLWLHIPVWDPEGRKKNGTESFSTITKHQAHCHYHIHIHSHSSSVFSSARMAFCLRLLLIVGLLQLAFPGPILILAVKPCLWVIWSNHNTKMSYKSLWCQSHFHF